MPSLRDYHCKRPEGPKYISLRCQPQVGSETTKVPEAQDDFIEEGAFASGMKTDDRVFTPSPMLEYDHLILCRFIQLFEETDLSFQAAPI
jgi:hypothetical protein